MRSAYSVDTIHTNVQHVSCQFFFFFSLLRYIFYFYRFFFLHVFAIVVVVVVAAAAVVIVRSFSAQYVFLWFVYRCYTSCWSIRNTTRKDKCMQFIKCVSMCTIPHAMPGKKGMKFLQKHKHNSKNGLKLVGVWSWERGKRKRHTRKKKKKK